MIVGMAPSRSLVSMALLVSLGCGRTWMVQSFDGDGSGTDEDTGDVPVATTAVTTAVSDGTTSGDDGVDSDVDPCAVGPVVIGEIPYSGSALRTVAQTLVRGPDGTLYMGGTRAGPNDMEMWIAALDPSGALRWETTALAREGGNLAGWTPTVSDLYVDGDLLRFAGFTYETEPIAWFGSATIGDGEIFEATANDFAMWYGNAPTERPDARYLVGRIYGPEGYLIVRMEEGVPAWGFASTEAGSFDDYAAGVASTDSAVFVAGRFQGWPWVVGITATGEIGWDEQVYGTPIFEGEGGGFQTVETANDVVVGGGDLRLEKPMADGTGSYTYNQALLASWTLAGDPLWTWQREPEVVRPGIIEALTIGTDGTIYVTGTENAIHGTPYFFAAAISPDGALLWSIDDETQPDDPLLQSLDGKAIALGEPGQLWVLADAGGLSEETTTLLEICYPSGS